MENVIKKRESDGLPFDEYRKNRLNKAKIILIKEKITRICFITCFHLFICLSVYYAIFRIFPAPLSSKKE